MKFLILGFGLIGFAWSGQAFSASCDPDRVPTKSAAFALQVQLISAACQPGQNVNSLPIFTGDVISMKLNVLPRGKDQPSDIVAVEGIGLQRADGLPAASPPAIRKVGKGVYFADNFDFTAAGTWDVTVQVKVSGKSEPMKFPLEVRLNAMQADAVAADPTPVPKFVLKDMDGKTVTQAAFLGKVTVTNFFFASCPTICPLMAQKLAGLQKQFKNKSTFRMVSITTDPSNDSPVVLRDFAKRYQAEAGLWSFWRGPKPAVVALSAGGLSLDVTRDSPVHSTKFAVVDGSGIVRGRFDSTKVEEVEQLKVLVRDLLD